MTLNIIGHKKIYLAVSAIVVAAFLVPIFLFGFKPGVDFGGGTMWQFRTGEDEAAIKDIEGFIKTQTGATTVIVNRDEESGVFFARLQELGEEEHQAALAAAVEKFPFFEELSFNSIGPSVGNDLRKNAVMAVVFVLLGISLYVAFAFRKASRPISSWKYGVITLITLFHDVAIPAGLLAILGYMGRVEIDTNFVVALLVVMGFSVHDTIVVFDRTRENLLADRGKTDIEVLINSSVNQVMARSINTSLTLILVLLALYFAGPPDLKYFILTLLVGVGAGVYSSIFVASPMLAFMGGRASKK